MRKSVWLAATLLLAGCGGGGDKAVEACATELANRLSGKTFALDKADMLAKAKPEADALGDHLLSLGPLIAGAGLSARQLPRCNHPYLGASTMSIWRPSMRG